MRSRRAFLTLAAGLTITPLLPRAAWSQNRPSQVVGLYRRGVGDITITAILDGYLPLDPAMLTGADATLDNALLEEAFLPAGGVVPTSINAYVIETGDRTIMVDGGAAEAFGPTAGKTSLALAVAGVGPEKVDTVVCSHLHPDHVGALTSGGDAMFPNAALKLHSAEHAFWTNDANFTGVDETTQGFVALAQATVRAYGERVELFEDGADIAPGVTAMHLPGHTPGHTGLMVASGDQSLLLWGDIVHLGPIQFARPDVTIAFDVDQPLAAATRARVFDQVATDRLEIAGAHVDFPSFGRLEIRGEGYRLRRSRWDHEL